MYLSLSLSNDFTILRKLIKVRHFNWKVKVKTTAWSQHSNSNVSNLVYFLYTVKSHKNWITSTTKKKCSVAKNILSASRDNILALEVITTEARNLFTTQQGIRSLTIILIISFWWYVNWKRWWWSWQYQSTIIVVALVSFWFDRKWYHYKVRRIVNEKKWRFLHCTHSVFCVCVCMQFVGA